MIVRTYGRRGRGIGRTLSDTSLNDDVEDPYSFRGEEPSSFSLSQDPYSFREDLESSQRICNFTFSSQDSTRWTSDSWENSNSSPLQLLAPIDKAKGGERKSLKLNDGRREKALPPTATLMETQEYGEMMECVDEVDFALDGLRMGQGVRVRRASLLSLLNVCGTSQQRRLLKAQGMAKSIVDAILDLSLDDSPSNLAAATLFYILTSDGQDSYLLDTSPSIQFLLQLLKPMAPDAGANKARTISQKLLALHKDMHNSQDVTKKSSSELIHKVMETLVTCKDLKTSSVRNDDLSRPELNPNWVSLLTMEKACLSTVSIEDTTSTIRKTGGNFKEKLRELGGLDAVFELALSFHSTLEGLIEHVTPSVRESKERNLQCLPLLLKCLKIMENATFLSKANQSHLLGLKRTLPGQGSSLSFVKLMLNFIKVLSDLTLLRTSSATSSPEMPTNHSYGADRYAELLLNAGQQVDSNVVSSSRSSQECSSSGRYSSDTGLSASQNNHWFSSFLPGSLPSNGGITKRSGADKRAIEISSSSSSGNRVIDISSSTFGSYNLTSKSSDSGAPVNGHGSKTNLSLGKRPYDDDDDLFIDLEESQDPFAFDEDEFEPTKWDMLSGRRHKGQRKQKSKLTAGGAENRCLSMQMLTQEECQSQPMLNQKELGNEQQNEGYHHSSDTSCTTALDEENSNLVADCLLTSIKVLMNLTNDNAFGCRQIAIFGGLETLSQLIARHFPLFRNASFSEMKENTLVNNSIPELGSQTDVHLSDQELDFLVTILGLLVNMVENDGNNRSQLAAAKVALPCSGELNEVDTGVIPLFCSIFLANRGAGETAEEEHQSWDEEEVVLQGEKEAEKMIVEAYAALLLAFLSTESKRIRDTIAYYLPDRSLKVLVPVLERFVTFHLALNMISPETHRTVSEVIESCRLP